MGRSVTSVAFSPDGRTLATGGVESKSNLDLANMASASSQKKSKKQTAQQPGPDEGSQVDAIGQVCSWDTPPASNSELSKDTGKGVTAVVFSRDGKLLASRQHLITRLRFGTVASKREPAHARGAYANISRWTSALNGRLLASASDEGSTFLWDTNTGNILTLISLDEWRRMDGGYARRLFDGTARVMEPDPLAL